jgi:hypothetical protein
VPIRKYLGDNPSFGPEDLDAMGKGIRRRFDKARFARQARRMVEMVARRIVRAALAGERSAIKLTEIGAGGRE